MLSFRVFVASHARTGFPHLRPRPLTSSISFRINTCKSVSKQTTLTPFRMNTYEKHRGVGVLLLTTHPMRMRILSECSESKDPSSHPIRESVLRSIATKDLSTHPMRMRILPAPSISGSESKDLSSHPTRESVPRSIATKDLSSHPIRESLLRSIATKDLSSHPMRIRILPPPTISGSEPKRPSSNAPSASCPGPFPLSRSPSC